jgi:glycerophosphoryl diester phosphodiesterase
MQVSLRSLQILLVVLAINLAGGAARAQYIIGHRGASHAAPENTLAAFRLAWRQGADGVEGDFHLSADKKIVCIHDEDTERVAGVKHVVKETRFADLRKLDVGAWKSPRWVGERIPTLEEVLATVPRGKLMFVELKCGPEIVAPLAEILAVATVPARQIIVISFDAETIAECERRMPELKSYWLTSYKQDDDAWRPTASEVVDTMRRIRSDGLGSKAVPEYFDAQFLDRLRSGGVQDFHVWTVDDPEIARTYRSLGAWSITTNRPRMLRRELAETTDGQRAK